MLKLAKVLSIAAVLLSLAVGAVSASEESMPDSPLYSIKLQFENWRLASEDDPETRIQMAMAVTQARVREVVRLVESGQEIPEGLASRYQARIELALQNLDEATGEQLQERLRDGMCEQLALQVRTMTQLMAKPQAGDCAGECPAVPLQQMIQAGTAAQQKLSAPEDNGAGPKGPDNTPEEPGTEKPVAPVMNGPQGPARSGDAFDSAEIQPTGPIGPSQPCGPGRPGGSRRATRRTDTGRREQPETRAESEPGAGVALDAFHLEDANPIGTPTT